jgi:hypothetical protein
MPDKEMGRERVKHPVLYDRALRGRFSNRRLFPPRVRLNRPAAIHRH